MTEPNPNIAPVRSFISGERSYFQTLAELRVGMSEVDEEIVRLLARRAEFVRQAVLFKIDLDECAAPEQQEANIVRACERAEAVSSRLPGFTGIVEIVYTKMVPAYVAAQQDVFAQTVLNTDEPSQVSDKQKDPI